MNISLKPAMFDPAALARDVRVLDVDLARLAETGQLLVGGLGGDDAGMVASEPSSPMAKRPR